MLVVTATVWSGVMVFGGMWLSWPGVVTIPIPEPVVRALGIAAFSGGNFIFMALVADRCFPRASRSMVMTLEAMTFIVFAGALAWLVVLLGPIGG